MITKPSHSNLILERNNFDAGTSGIILVRVLYRSMSSWVTGVVVAANAVQAGLSGVRISLGAGDFSLL